MLQSRVINYGVSTTQGHHNEFEPGKVLPQIFDQLFLIIAYWNPKSRQGPVLKYGSEEKDSSLCFLLGFLCQKKQERLRSELLSEDKITNLLGFLT